MRQQKKKPKWIAQIQVAGKNEYIGIFASETEAARARDAYSKEHPELFASINFPIKEAT